MQKDDKVFILGGNERRNEKEKELKCFFCNGSCFFTDKWNFKKYYPVCERCGMEKIKEEMGKGNADILLHEKTIKSLAKHYNIEEWEANILAKKLMYEYTGIEPRVVKRTPKIKSLIR